MKLSRLGSSCGVAVILLVAPALFSLPPMVNAHSLPVTPLSAGLNDPGSRDAGVFGAGSVETVHRLVVQVVED